MEGKSCGGPAPCAWSRLSLPASQLPGLHWTLRGDFVCMASRSQRWPTSLSRAGPAKVPRLMPVGWLRSLAPLCVSMEHSLQDGSGLKPAGPGVVGWAGQPRACGQSELFAGEAGSRRTNQVGSLLRLGLSRGLHRGLHSRNFFFLSLEARSLQPK